MKNMHDAIYSAYHAFDNDKWIDLLFETPDQSVINGITFPGFPSREVQINMVGSAGAGALHEAAAMYREIHSYARKNGLIFTPDTRVLDFGCGFGRMLRFFLKDVAPGNLIGTDVYPMFVDICNDLFQSMHFDNNEPYPPLPYPDASFDIIYAYSVFSHLSEPAHLQWLKEFRRIIRPGGLIFLTLRQKKFLKIYNKKIGVSGLSQYEDMLVRSFGDQNAMLPRYEAGEYIYVASGGGGALTNDFYGEAVIPEKYIEKVWTQYFDIIDLFDKLSRLPQALIVLRPKIAKADECERHVSIKNYIKKNFPRLSACLRGLRDLLPGRIGA